MATAKQQIRDKLNRLIRQPGSDQLRQNEDGAMTATVTYRCSWDNVLSLMPRRNVSKHPDFNDLICRDVSVTREPPGIAVITVNYGGLSGRENTFGTESGEFAEVTELTTGLRQEPIETHPDFESTLAGSPGNELNEAKFDSDGIFIGFGSGSPFFGITDYLVPSSTFRRIYVSRTRPSSMSVGNISSSPTGAPDPGGDYNWLAAGLSWTKQGGYYRITLDYMLSGPKGFNSAIYS